MGFEFIVVNFGFCRVGKSKTKKQRRRSVKKRQAKVKGTLQEMQQKVKMAPPKNKLPSRRVSIFSPGWGISVGVKTVELSKLILKEFKKKMHEQYVFVSFLLNFFVK
ncbi:hypothetical protein C1H46_042661 [Malus baccata]|uniref:Uncharacterized protein n=1 Tax=Malus baccata TaxID=106549 RepID=A0A540KC38_MALBA|nr:hypothetical protein C1H46_042661 [Malus baccata]